MEFPCVVVVLPHDDVLTLVSNDITSRKKSISANFDGCIAVTLHLNRFQARAREARVDCALPKRTDGRRPANEVAVCWKELSLRSIKIDQRRRVTTLERISDLSVYRFDLRPNVARHR
jgi:hypothetical protein